MIRTRRFGFLDVRPIAEKTEEVDGGKARRRNALFRDRMRIVTEPGVGARRRPSEVLRAGIGRAGRRVSGRRPRTRSRRAATRA
jgi:hypothetical protein